MTFDGANPPEGPLSVGFVSADPDLTPFRGQGSQVVDVRNDGTFLMRALHGLGRLRVTNLRGGWALKSISVGGTDVTDTPLPLGTKEQSLKDVEIILTNQLTELRGTVADASGRPLRGSAQVLVFSTDRERWYEGSRFMVTSPTNREMITTPPMPPGDYYVVAIDRLQPEEFAGGWKDPILLALLARVATRVTLTEGQKTSVTLKLVPR